MVSVGDVLHQRKAAHVLLASRGKCISNALRVARGPGHWVWENDFLPNMMLKGKGGEAQKISLAFLMAPRWALM